MNLRGPFYQGYLRFMMVNGKGRERGVTLFRLILNIVFGLAGLGVLIFLFARMGWRAFVSVLPFYLGLVSIPASMATGKGLVLKENEAALNQLSANMRISINKEKAIFGYILIFAPLFIVCGGSLLLPIHKLWFAVWFPLTVVTVIISTLTKHTVENIGFRMWKYNLFLTLSHILSFAIGALIRIYVILPWMETHLY